VPKTGNHTHRRSSLSSTARPIVAPPPAPAPRPSQRRPPRPKVSAPSSPNVIHHIHPHPSTLPYHLSTSPPLHTQCSEVRRAPYTPPPSSRQQLGSERQRKSKADTHPPAPPAPSAAELERASAQTASDIKWTAASAAVLYLCAYPWDFRREREVEMSGLANDATAPFLVEYVYKLI
jgi:hypothetical protein